MKTSVYLLSAALVGSLGLNAAQLAAIGDARAGVAESKIVSAEAVYSIAQASSATGAQLASAGCSTIDSDLGLTGDNVCTISDVMQICLYLNDINHPGEVVMRVMADIDGTWTGGSPE